MVSLFFSQRPCICFDPPPGQQIRQLVSQDGPVNPGKLEERPMPDGNIPFSGGSGPTWNDAMMLAEARRRQAENPNYIPGPGEPDFFHRRPPATPEELDQMAAHSRNVRAVLWMLIFPPIGILLLLRSRRGPGGSAPDRLGGRTPTRKIPAWVGRAALWASLAFIFAGFAISYLARGDLVDVPAALAIAVGMAWRAWRNVSLHRVGASEG